MYVKLKGKTKILLTGQKSVSSAMYAPNLASTDDSAMHSNMASRAQFPTFPSRFQISGVFYHTAVIDGFFIR